MWNRSERDETEVALDPDPTADGCTIDLGAIGMDAEQLTCIWNQREIPVILRRTGKGELLRLRLPYAETNRSWLQNDRRTSPAWIASKRCWEIPKAWFNDFVERALAAFGAVYVI